MVNFQTPEVASCSGSRGHHALNALNGCPSPSTVLRTPYIHPRHMSTRPTKPINVLRLSVYPFNQFAAIGPLACSLSSLSSFSPQELEPKLFNATRAQTTLHLFLSSLASYCQCILFSHVAHYLYRSFTSLSFSLTLSFLKANSDKILPSGSNGSLCQTCHLPSSRTSHCCLSFSRSSKLLSPV